MSEQVKIRVHDVWSQGDHSDILCSTKQQVNELIYAVEDLLKLDYKLLDEDDEWDEEYWTPSDWLSEVADGAAYDSVRTRLFQIAERHCDG